MSASATRPLSLQRLSLAVNKAPPGFNKDTVTKPLTVTANQPSIGFPPNRVSEGENITRENFSPKFVEPDWTDKKQGILWLISIPF